jgi:serine/threonine-protein kinase
VEDQLPVKWGIYTLDKELGRGGMAVVYAASKERPGFERSVCIKQILPSLSDDPEFVKMFEQEAGIASSLSHPNIVAVTDFDRVEGQLFLEMELVEGLDLQRLLGQVRAEGTSLPLGFARFVAECLLAALAHAHGKTVGGEPAPVIHRDVSPANVLLSKEGEVKLADFGIAKVRGSAVTTEVGDVKGKLAYLSPEQARGEGVDPRTDLYSAGLVLHELLTGRRFNRGEDHKGQIGQAMSPDDPELPWLSADWNDLLGRLLAKDKDDRFDSADEALAALERIPLAEPYGRGEARGLVQRLFGKPATPSSEHQPTELGTPVDFAEVATDARPGDGRARPGRLRWALVALAIAVALGLGLLAGTVIDRLTATEPPASPEPSAVAAPHDSLVASADAGPAQSGAAADAEPGDRPPLSEAKGPGFGRLQVNCRPWARVLVDGRDVGTTPIKSIKVRAGKRRVTLLNDERGYERTFTVHVPRGGTGSLSKEIPAGEAVAEP